VSRFVVLSSPLWSHREGRILSWVLCAAIAASGLVSFTGGMSYSAFVLYVGPGVPANLYLAERV
jgi:hypothetical protein